MLKKFLKKILNYFRILDSARRIFKYFKNCILMFKMHTFYSNINKKNKPNKDAVILFCCHYINDSIINEFNKIKNSCSKKFDIVLLYDISKNDLKITNQYNYHFVYSKTMKKLGYKINKNELYYNPEYSVLDFYLANPCYMYYWRLDYDVRFKGEWPEFFNSFFENKSDLLATYIKKYADKREWPWWNSMSFEIDNDKKIGAFFPVLRFSKRALKLLDEKYKSGFYGFCEIIVPTLLSLEGFKVNDIGSKWYDSTTFRYAPGVLLETNKLSHPIK